VRGEGPVEAAGQLEAREIVVRNPQIADRALWRVRIPQRTGAVVVSVAHQGREVVNPEPEQLLHRGDRLLAIGSAEQLDLLERLCAEGEERRGLSST
jgi:K+/H+ antiporter YhaU regulatory subunit KhtT